MGCPSSGAVGTSYNAGLMRHYAQSKWTTREGFAPHGQFVGNGVQGSACVRVGGGDGDGIAVVGTNPQRGIKWN